tara:strand:+ start:1373 stop:1798 length:426 start_codon:yes stop_codon:yes gene_type:complete
MRAYPYVIAAVFLLVIVFVIGNWYFSSSSESEALEDDDQGDESIPSTEAAPNDDAMDTYDSFPSETANPEATESTTANPEATESTTANPEATESTTVVMAQDVTSFEDVVPTEQIEFINNKQSQIKTFLSTEFYFLSSLNA